MDEIEASIFSCLQFQHWGTWWFTGKIRLMKERCREQLLKIGEYSECDVDLDDLK